MKSVSKINPKPDCLYYVQIWLQWQTDILSPHWTVPDETFTQPAKWSAEIMIKQTEATPAKKDP